MVYHKEFELTPIEVAVDAMQNKVADLEDVVGHTPPDLKKIQLKLQGSVSVQVNTQGLGHWKPRGYEDRVYSLDTSSTLNV